MEPEKKYKYDIVIDYVTKYISANSLTEGDRLPTEQQISESLNLSRISVQRGIKRLEKDGIVYRVQGSGTFVGAASARPSSNLMIPFLMSRQFNQIHGLDIIQGAQDFMMNNACHLSPYCVSGNDPAEYERSITSLINSGSRCLMVMCPEAAYDESFYVRYLQEGVKFIFIDTKIDSFFKVNYVSSDNEMGGFVATEHLIRQGHRKIALICHHMLVNCYKNLALRMRGYTQALKRYGIPAEKDYIRFCPHEDNVAEVVDDLMSGDNPPTALFTLNDTAAEIAIHALRSRGLRVPEDVSVIGFDNLKPHLGISTVEQDFYRMGFYGAKLALDNLRDDKYPTTSYCIPVKCIGRASTIPEKTVEVARSSQVVGASKA